MSQPLAPTQFVKIQNDSGYDIPAHSVVVVDSVEIVPATNNNEAYLLHHVKKYTGQAGNILITGAVKIPQGTTGTGGWSSAKYFGQAFADPIIYVAIDPSADNPTKGEQWGPVSGQWYLSRKGAGFFAMGHPSSDLTNGFSIKRSVFLRGAPAPRWGKAASTVTAGSLGTPTATTVDIWEKNYSSGASPKAYAVTTHTELLALPAVNVPSDSGSSGLLLKLEWIDNQWMVTGADCS